MGALKEIIEKNDSIKGKSFDYSIQALILISLVSFSLETLPNISSSLMHSLKIIELICIAIFSMEYFLRIFVAERKFKFIFSFYGLIDLIAILPFFISTGIDLRAIRIFRFLRLFKLFRYNNSIHLLFRALVIVKDELVLFSSVALMVLFIAAVGIYYFENPAQPENITSIFEGLWWAVATLTTVGYGDIYPITTGGKIFTFIILMIGLGIVAVPTGIVASALSEARRREASDYGD